VACVDAPIVERWLQTRFRRDANLCVALGPVAILAGMLVLFLTFWFMYAVVYLGGETVNTLVSLFGNGHFKLRHLTRLWLAGGPLMMLIVGYLRRNPFGHLPRTEFDDGLGRLRAKAAAQVQAQNMAHAYGFGGGGSPFALLLFPRASSQMITDLLFTGPRLLFGGWGLLRESARLRPVDTAGLAQVLAGHPGKVRNGELVALCPDLNFVQTLHDLQLLPEVVWLELGLSLTAEFRAELRALG
jgi:hypothetical protein